MAKATVVCLIIDQLRAVEGESSHPLLPKENFRRLLACVQKPKSERHTFHHVFVNLSGLDIDEFGSLVIAEEVIALKQLESELHQLNFPLRVFCSKSEDESMLEQWFKNYAPKGAVNLGYIPPELTASELVELYTGRKVAV